jgi:hypothetical protein
MTDAEEARLGRVAQTSFCDVCESYRSRGFACGAPEQNFNAMPPLLIDAYFHAGGADIPPCGTVNKPGQAMDRMR